MAPRRTGDSPRWRRYLRFWGPDPVADVDDEFRFHVEERIEDLMARGFDPRAAREEAMRGFGDLEQVKWTCQALALEKESAMRKSEWLDAMKQPPAWDESGMASAVGSIPHLAYHLGAIRQVAQAASGPQATD